MTERERSETAYGCFEAGLLRGEERRQFWQGHIAGWENSGLKQVEYCRRHGLKWSSFHYWRKRLKSDTAEPGFVEVSSGTVAQAFGTGGPGLVVLFADRYRIEIGDNFNPYTLARLVHTLGQL